MLSHYDSMLLVSLVYQLVKPLAVIFHANMFQLKLVVQYLNHVLICLLQLSEWGSTNNFCRDSSVSHAVQLDLIGTVRGLDAAESYFSNLTDTDKDERTYGALLSCYTRKGLVDKSLSLMQTMKEFGFASRPLAYNNLMYLYSNTDQPEKILDVLSEMKKSGIPPDNSSYRICINSCGERSDFIKMEQLLEDMESQPHITMD